LGSILGFLAEPWFQECRLQRPVTAALLEAISTKMAAFIELGNSDTYTLEKLNSDLGCLASEIAELSPWIVGVKPLTNEKQVRERVASWVEFARDLGLPGGQIAEISKSADRTSRTRPRGRPPDRRRLAVKAYEMKAANHKLTWEAVTEALCDCRKSQHDEYCKESLRQVVMTLQKTLRKHGIVVPPLG